MAISLKTEHLKRYKDITHLLMKYGRNGWAKDPEVAELLEEDGEEQATPPQAKELADELERLGPTFIKLGQLLSTRADIIPIGYMDALSRLQDRVEPFPFEQVEKIVAEELGVRLSKAFSHFEPKPLAAASLGQVHQAVLRNGRPVAVKVQRPDIRQRIIEDLEALQHVAELLDKHTHSGKRLEFQKMLDEFRHSLLNELDYRREARHLTILGTNLEEFDRIMVPQPVEDYTTSRVLTMDFVRGTKVTGLSPVARLELDGEELARQLFRAYLKQILADGFFHADPHPGNIFVTDDGRVAMIDLGMVARLSPGMQEKLLQLLLAISEGRAEEASDIAIAIGDPMESFDERGFRRKVGDFVIRHQDVTVAQIAVGKVVLEITKLCAEHDIRPPSELTMLGKALLNLDQVGKVLDPRFDPNAAIRQYSVEVTRKRLAHAVSPGNVFTRMMEMKEFADRLPSRVNRILDALADNRLKLNVDAMDEVRLTEGFQKVANRITIGLILAALIVGAAMLMKVDTTWRILGYPGLAMLFFLVAAAGGIALIVIILFTDEKREK